MNTVQTIFRFQVGDALRSRWLILHFLLFLLLTEGLLLASGFSDKALVSLINVVLLLVPLISLVFGVIHQYNAREFVELLLTQPVRRRDLFAGLLAGIGVPMTLSFVIGIFLPFAWHGGLDPVQGARLFALLGLGSVLTLTCISVAVAVSIRQTDRIRGIGLALFLWLAYAVLFDGAIMLSVVLLDHWPIEKAMIVVMLMNPVDIIRLVLLQVFDAAAMMGYTGAVFTRFFEDGMGYAVAATALSFWLILPTWLARHAFLRKDF